MITLDIATGKLVSQPQGAPNTTGETPIDGGNFSDTYTGITTPIDGGTFT